MNSNPNRNQDCYICKFVIVASWVQLIEILQTEINKFIFDIRSLCDSNLLLNFLTEIQPWMVLWFLFIWCLTKMNLYWLVSTLWKGELSGLEFQLCFLADALQEDRVSHVLELSGILVIINMPAYLFRKNHMGFVIVVQ